MTRAEGMGTKVAPGKLSLLPHLLGTEDQPPSLLASAYPLCYCRSRKSDVGQGPPARDKQDSHL